MKRNGKFQIGIVTSLSFLMLLVTLWWPAVNRTSTTILAAPLQQTGSGVITIGMATRSADDFDYRHINAVRLAISQVNAAGGVMVGGNAYSLSLVMADTGNDNTRAITAANELINAGAVAVVGPMRSGSLSASQKIYNEAGVPFISPGSTVPNANPQGYTTTFRNTPYEGAGAIQLAEYFWSVGLERTSLICNPIWPAVTGYDISCDMADVYKNRYEALGGTIINIHHISATAEVTATLQAIEGEGPDALVATLMDINTVGEADAIAGLISRVRYTMGLTATYGYVDFLIEDSFISTASTITAAEGNFAAASGRRASDMPGWARFEADYLAENFVNGPTPDIFYAPYAYDAVGLIADALKRANTTDTLAIRNQIAATANYTGVFGTYVGFDAYGDMIPQPGRVDVVKNGRWIPVVLEAEFYPDQGGIFDLEDTWAQSTTITIPPDTVTNTLSMVYNLAVPTTNTGLFTQSLVSEHAVRVESNVTISSPMTITIQYNDEDVAGVDESALILYTWDGSAWVDAQPCGGYVRDLANNVLQAVVCHFSDYVLLEETKAVYLPIILK